MRTSQEGVEPRSVLRSLPFDQVAVALGHVRARVAHVVADALERDAGVAIVGTSRPEAEVVLTVIEAWTPERLREVASSLREYVDRAA